MKRMPYKRPTEHYDERIKAIDEALCILLKKRKDVSDNRPGYPPFAYIEAWAADNGLYEDQLKYVFGLLMDESLYRPIVEPAGFRKNLLAARQTEFGEAVYAVPFVRQYENASVVHFTIDRSEEEDAAFDRSRRYRYYELTVGDGYECGSPVGSSHGGHHAHDYIVSPPLPDDLAGFEFTFREYERRGEQMPTGREIVIRM
ncbi:hypothetical protein SAMN02799624_03159 [Paenibacillus sp. UNC496MF]|uniref:hypothetical protein n=1 Tax=Paenibacillus sp. UNC496MF TaxID=1502753 RepID=UPI0008E7CB4E|nr:hypothetical protein [Paenibacillus sp. UNC496MF]SFJ04574.1 hypothetical protein SAMN02799624_03159 [Paenibacillus sp. UNC496MF]